MPGGAPACKPATGQRRYDRRCRRGHDQVTEYIAGDPVTAETTENPVDYREDDEDEALGKCSKAETAAFSCGRQVAPGEPRQRTLDTQRLSFGSAGLHRILALP